MIEGCLAHSGFEVTGFRTENDQIYVAYEPLFASSNFALKQGGEGGSYSVRARRTRTWRLSIQTPGLRYHLRSPRSATA